MEPTADVYADLLFFINAGMDCLCFSLTARLLRRQVLPWRIALGSAAGGLYAVAALLFEVGRWAALLIDLAVCVLLCLAVFADRQEGIRTVLPAVGVYLLISLLLGGIMTGLCNLLNRAGCAEVLAVSAEDGPTAWLFALLALASGGISLWGGRLFRRAGARQTCTVTIELNGRSVTLRGIVDTGNLLSDPLGGGPVIPVDRSAAAPLLSSELAKALSSGCTEGLDRVPEASRIRLIPAVTAAGRTMLVALRPDRVSLSVTGGRLRTGERLIEAQALFAPAEMPAASGQAERPQALVPAAML